MRDYLDLWRLPDDANGRQRRVIIESDRHADSPRDWAIARLWLPSAGIDEDRGELRRRLGPSARIEPTDAMLRRLRRHDVEAGRLWGYRDRALHILFAGNTLAGAPWPFNGMFDLSEGGIIYVTAQDARRHYNGRDWRAWARQVMRSEVWAYNDYLAGLVGVVVIQSREPLDDDDDDDDERGWETDDVMGGVYPSRNVPRASGPLGPYGVAVRDMLGKEVEQAAAA